MIDILKATAAKIDEEKDYLTELDNEIADGDHGVNMAKGFNAVVAKLDAMSGKDIGSLLKTTGMTLVSTVGGSAGPLYGTAYMKAGSVLSGKNEMDEKDLVAAMEAAIGGIQMRGKATTGEKTMLDSLCPAYDALKSGVEAGEDMKTALTKAVEAAETGVEYTKTIKATKGRASYIGDRSIGHQDPGATSALYILQVLLDNI
ncbi:MAG: dihydroxyacetone kinase subunit L [Anaerovibrio sp.]|uniref:dihydroxyacetone kinase subunit DhaL n=1 Tax=Anaerovibrio sp. TaxID=1872532 RepID=UPI0025E3DA74|nr:dihydroxyacetone kinase subunit DhaL [Anaerovibrio sp.]MCR5176429.1 dihydroxyacetone kinase subunit L [Anaerovibrio sp.]